MKKLLAILLFALSGPLLAHQFTPTYPQFAPSYVDGVLSTKMELFNKRKDVEYYELGVFTKDWEPVSFASEGKMVRVKYLETKKLNVYIKVEDLKSVSYICTESRLRKEDVRDTVISSRICSKVK